jgi:hypothetical protein
VCVCVCVRERETERERERERESVCVEVWMTAQIHEHFLPRKDPCIHHVVIKAFNLGTSDIWDQIILCPGDCPVHC